MARNNVDKYFNFLGGSGNIPTFDFKKKKLNQTIYYQMMLTRALEIFEYKNLPDTIPQWAIEMPLLQDGYVAISKYEDDLYAYTGGFGGEPNVYYMPTRFIITNPYQKLNKECVIDEDCVMFYNTDTHMGLYDLFCRYATAISETDLTISRYTVLKRSQALISSTDDITYKSALKYMQDLENGEFSAILDDALENSIKSQPLSEGQTNIIQNLIELRTYWLNTWLNDIGIEASTNMKRENVSELESSHDNDMLLPFIANMLKNRKEACERVNKLYGTNIEVDLKGVWKEKAEEDKEDEKIDGDISGLDD